MTRLNEKYYDYLESGQEVYYPEIPSQKDLEEVVERLESNALYTMELKEKRYKKLREYLSLYSCTQDIRDVRAREKIRQILKERY